jgi:hypothetical protein
MNGRVQVDFTSAALNKPLSLSTVNGNLHLAFPARLRAKVKLDSLTGKIVCDYDIRTNAAAGKLRGKGLGQRPGVPGATVTGMIGAGGPEILVKSVNGSIYLRKKT